jgi:hypothetical protein
MRNWLLQNRLSKLPREAEVFMQVEPTMIEAGEPADTKDLIEVTRIELDPEDGVVLS